MTGASGELPVERFAERWLETQADLLGDSVALADDYGLWWSYVWHFVDAPGYVYAYAYGHLLALSVYRRYEQEGPGFAGSYLDSLRAGARSRPSSSAGSWGWIWPTQAGPRASRPARAPAGCGRAGGRRGRPGRVGLGGGDRRGTGGAAGRRGRAHATARAGGAARRGGLRARAAPPLLAELWQSSVALAHDVAPRSLRGARTPSSAAGWASRASPRRGPVDGGVASDWSELGRPPPRATRRATARPSRPCFRGPGRLRAAGRARALGHRRRGRCPL